VGTRLKVIAIADSTEENRPGDLNTAVKKMYYQVKQRKEKNPSITK